MTMLFGGKNRGKKQLKVVGMRGGGGETRQAAQRQATHCLDCGRNQLALEFFLGVKIQNFGSASNRVFSQSSVKQVPPSDGVH